MHYQLIAVIAGLLVASVPGAFAQSGPAFSTYQAWEFGATGDVLATSPIEDISGDGADDLVVAAQSKLISLVDGATGETVWTYVPGEAYVWTAVMESPHASEDGKPDVLASTKDSILMLDGAAGKKLWNFSTSTSSSDLCFPSIRSMHIISDIDGDGLSDVAVVTGSGDGCAKNDKIAVIALGAQDGGKIWEYSNEEDYHGLKDGNRGSSPAVAIDLDTDGAIDMVVVDDHNVMHVIDGQTGSILETAELDVFGVIWNLMIVPDISGDGIEDAIALEFIEGGGGPDYAGVNAVDLASAEVIWQARAGDGLFDSGAVYSMAWLPVDETIHIAVTQRIENDLHLAVLNADSGEQVWQFDLGEEKSRKDIDKYYPVARVPNLSESSHDEIAVGSIGSRLYLLDGMSGNTIWSHPIDEQISDIMSIGLQGPQEYIVVEDRDKGVRALAGLTAIETALEISASAQTLALTPLPDRITISGAVTPVFRGEVVELRYVDPTGHVLTAPLIVAGDGSFTHVLEPQIVGTWKVTAEFDGEGYYLDSKSSTISFTVTEQEPGSSIYRLEVEGSEVSYPITYKIEGGNVTGMSVDKESKSLDIAISTTQDGTLTIKLPRNVIDAFDSSYQVYVDSEAADFQETEVGAEFRTLAIPFSSNAEQVQILGTYIVPEFPATLIIMMAAIVGIVVATAMHSRRFPNIFSS
jgi:outer membrane protein assembly factor BamB